jgi:hypothetical protein
MVYILSGYQLNLWLKLDTCCYHPENMLFRLKELVPCVNIISYFLLKN